MEFSDSPQSGGRRENMDVRDTIGKANGNKEKLDRDRDEVGKDGIGSIGGIGDAGNGQGNGGDEAQENGDDNDSVLETEEEEDKEDNGNADSEAGEKGHGHGSEDGAKVNIVSISQNEDKPGTPENEPVVDYEANLQSLLEPAPDGLDSITGCHTFKIKNLTEMLIENERFKGPKFQIGNYIFNLILVCNKKSHYFFSVYLEGHPVDETEKDIWSFPVQFTFDAWDPDNPHYHKSNNTRFRFNQRVTDWGFVQFLDGKSAIDSKFFRNNKVNLTVYVRIIDDYTNVLYSDFRDYDSKKYTGYVGIENQGATCYLNSLLQSYFFTKIFRKKVYQIPTEDEINLDMDSYEEYKQQPKTVSLALQRIFYKLQTSNVAINSLELTDSFGWTTADAFTQHDVQELNRILMDRLENKMKGTDIDGCLNNIFVGKMSSFIRCIDVDYESSRTEDFWDIQLNVKGLKNIQESFENYVELEILNGDNKYDASGYGLQDAEKGVIFESFPDVLHVQLKRYEYDFETDTMVKIHDKYEFFDKIDLKPYISKNASNYDEDWEYQLHGVLVHQGDVSVGHYYAMIKPTEEDKWFKFDDDRVSRVTPTTVFEEGFGCGPPMNVDRSMTRDQYQNYIIKHHTSAYMLVYIRKSKISTVLGAVTDSDIPPHISKQINYENEQEMKIKQEKEEMHLYINFRVYTDSTFSAYEGFDIGPNFEDRHYFAENLYDEKSFPLMFRILKTDKWNSIFNTIGEILEDDSTNENKLRLWNIIKRTNRTFRPDRPIDSFIENIEDATVGEVAHILETGVSRRKYAGNDRPIILSLYLEDASKDLNFLSKQLTSRPNEGNICELMESVENHGATLASISDSSNILVFLKYFSLKSQSIMGLSHIIIPQDSTTEFLDKIIKSTFNIPDDENILYFEEFDFMKRLEIKPNTTFYKNEIGNGDIISVDIGNYGEMDHKSLETENKIYFKSLEDRYLFLESRIHFNISQLERVDEDEEDYVFIDNNKDLEISDKIIDTWLSYYSSYLDIATVISEHVPVSPEYIKLSILSNGNKIDLRSDYNFTKLLCNVSKQNTVKLYYEVLTIPLKQFESMKLYHIYWVGNGICKEEKHDFYLPSSSTVDHIVSKLQSRLGLDGDIKDDVFCWIPDQHHRIKRLTSPDLQLDNNDSLIVGIYPQYREQQNPKTASKDVVLVAGYQCYGSLENTHGLPFVFDVIKNERIPETYSRVRKLLGLSEKEFKFTRVGITNGSSVEYMDPVSNPAFDFYTCFCKGNYGLVVEHPDRRARGSAQHSSIVIK